jgi:hypothetical protein
MFEIKKQPQVSATALIRPATKHEYLEYESIVKNISQESMLTWPKTAMWFEGIKSDSHNKKAQNLLFVHKGKND